MQIHDEFSQNLDILYHSNQWNALDEALSETTLRKAQNRDWYAYKMVAMSNLESRKTSDELFILAKEALSFWPERFFFCFLVDMHIARGQYEEALALLNSWGENDPENPDIQGRLFECYKNLNDQNSQLRALFHFHFFTGKAQLNGLNFAAASESFEQCHKMAPDFEPATLLYAQCLFYGKKFSQVLKVCQSIAATSQIKAAADELAMLAAVREGNLALGKDLAKSVLAQDSGNLVALRSLLRIAEAEGDLLNGIYMCQKILDEHSFDVAANLKLIQLTKALIEGRHTTIAFTEEQKVSLAELLLRSGHYAAGTDLLEAITPDSANYVGARETLAKHHIAQRNYEEALACLAPTEHLPRQWNYFSALAAECLYKLERYTQAAAEARRDLAENPHHLRSGFLLSASLLQNYHNDRQPVLDEWEEIQHLLTDYCEDNPDDGAPYLHLAHLAHILGNAQQIHELITQARIRGHRSPFASLLMGRHHLACGNKEEALDEFNDAVNLCSQFPYYSALIARAELLMDMGKTEMAENDLRVLLQHWPKDPRVITLRDAHSMGTT
ncbi:hypothetical protein DWB84_14555 [Saccharophagus sp. K07]|jgi:tetratricopeptide (TPR) repeat protein|uniref:hypothetical protein n=1 Tax=Saccharophagus sp. K07 TaxID=2283636 RepID=UPI0016527842|nr:hypothetical protein [Saccharophagus sp. K07]MBC6906671.1 hypothetical protein [Saccharophagus sp. K07]